MTEQPYAAQPAGAPVQQRPSNPFSGIPLVDVLRDVGAFVFLIATLFYDWNVDGGIKSGASLWFVDVSVVLAILGLTVSYLWKLGVLGAAWNPGLNSLIRLGLAVPFFLSVVAVVILDIADDRSVGVGVAVGIFGAILAAQPRKHELPPAHLAPSDNIWRYITAGLQALAALLVLVTTLTYIGELDEFGLGAGEIIIAIVSALLVAIALAFPAVTAFLRKPSGVSLIAGIGLGVLILGMLHIDGQGPSQFFGFLLLAGGWESVHFPGFGAFLLVAAAAAALSPGASRSTGGATHPVALVGAAKGAFLIIAISAVVHVLSVVFMLVADADFEGPQIVTLIFYVLIAVLAFFAFALTTPNGNKIVPLAAAGGYALLVTILAIIIAIIGDGAVGYVTTIGPGGYDDWAADSWLAAILVAIAIAVAVIGTSTIGGGVKKLMQNTQNAQAAQQGPAGAPLPGAPVAPAPVQPAPVQHAAPVAPTAPAAPVAPAAPAAPEPSVAPAAPVDPVVQRASDPTISQTELAQIAQDHPQARAAVAGNPQAYPGLLDWLRQLGDPEVDAALARRQG